MDQLSPTHADEFEDATDLFDVVLTLAEHLKLLLLGPLIAGALVYGLTFLLPQKFQSTAVLRAEADVAAFMTTATVLDASLANLGFLKDLSEEDVEEARIELMKRVTTQVGRNGKLVTLNVIAESPGSAQSLANEILKNAFTGLRPKGAELKRLESQKASLERQISELQMTSKTAQRLLNESSPAGNMGQLAESISSLSAGGVRMQEALLAAEKGIQGLSDDDLLQPPTLPKKPVAPRKGLTAILSAVGIGFLLLMFVLVRHFWTTSTSFEPHQQRLDALKRKYGIVR